MRLASAAILHNAGEEASAADGEMTFGPWQAHGHVATAFVGKWEPCQRWRVSDGLTDLDRWLTEWRKQDFPWLGGRSSPPLGGLPRSQLGRLMAARRTFRGVKDRLALRMYQPEAVAGASALTPLDRQLLRKDRAAFFAGVPEQEVKQMRQGTQILKEAVQRQAEREWEDGVEEVDYAERQRQYLSLRALRDKAVSTTKDAERCQAAAARALTAAASGAPSLLQPSIVAAQAAAPSAPKPVRVVALPVPASEVLDGPPPPLRRPPPAQHVWSPEVGYGPYFKSLYHKLERS
mmetsp:Transcript_67257/g.212823  ORF Transcript_67257/g.212823 Transcript_67257/m.212823 type:complete len:291 (-) Transcript_67257:7-879(-)